MERVGIKTRRTCLSLDYIKETYNKDLLSAVDSMEYTSTQMGKIAAERAIAQANLSPSDIGMVISGSCAPQYSVPANAGAIADMLSIHNASVLDMQSACSSFAMHLHWLNQMKPEKLPDYTLIVIPENWTRTVNYADRTTAVLVGDCAIAAVVSNKHKSKMKVAYTTISSDSSGYSKVVTPTGEHFRQEGPAVQRFAIKKTISTLKKLQEVMSCEPSEYYFIGHQANLLMLKSVCRNLGIDESKHLYNVDKYGNTGAASAPSVLSQNWTRFVDGDKIALVVVGAGLTWGGIFIEVGE